MTLIILLNILTFSIGLYSLRTKKKFENPFLLKFLLILGIILLLLYGLITFWDIKFKGIYTQEISLFGGISCLFLALNFVDLKILKVINIILLIFITPLVNQLIYIVLASLFGINIYNNEKILYNNNTSKVIAQSSSPGTTANEDIILIKPKTLLTESHITLHSMRYPEDSLIIKNDAGNLKMKDITKGAKFDTIIKQ